ncbi:hypothetical protein GCM10020221_20030 [Streptomyces thioluteus]|uniref:Iminophenyl-pyruvate dimer synthase domain-containing protein n=1 Tax=Streptomyces thioluteus TaxID=66431 RepID=A0ABP6J9U4_STRTU
MSVFDLPRLHFAGVATTRLPTGPRSGLNDLATNTALTDDGPAPAPFPTDRPAAEYHAWLHRRGPRFDSAGQPCADGAFSAPMGWNFDGNGHFLLDARVTAVEGPDGRPDPADPLVGRSVDVWGHYNPYLRTTVNRARVFDLDPASRWTMALMCGRFCFGRLGRSHDDGYLFTGGVTGFQPPRWTSFARVADVGEHVLADWLRYSAVHQFVVARDEAEWLDGIDSAAVRALRAAAEDGADGIVVRLALDDMASPPAPRLTRPVARAGHDRALARRGAAHLPGRPAPRPGPRLPAAPPHRGRPGGPRRPRHDHRGAGHQPCDAGRSGAAAPARPRRSTRARWNLRTTDGTLVARVPAGAYPSDATCGIVTVPAPGWRAAGGAALCLTRTGADGRPQTLLTEREAVVQSDDALVVLHHRDRARGGDHTVRVPLRSYVRGRPAAVGVRVRQYHNPRALPADPVAGAPGARCGDAVVLGVRTPDGEAYAPECALTTDERGHGVLVLRGERAGTCRVLLSAGPADVPCTDPRAPGSARAAYDDEDALGYWAGAGALAVRVLPDDWHLDRIPREKVDFDLLHREVFAYYEQTSTFMRSEVFSLADRCKVETYAELAWQMCDPRNKDRTYYMPPTRDLTDPKARLLLAYLRNRQALARPPLPVHASPAAPPPITTRGQLHTVLRQAATLELAVMLQYLYAAFSVPTHGAGLAYVRAGRWTARQLELACGRGGATLDDGIRGALLNVAREEMMHFLLVNNILMATGEPFHVPAIDFGTLNGQLPVPLDFALEGLGIGSVQRYIAVEQPAGLTPELRRPGREAGPGTPRTTAWGSVSELYAAVREGLRTVPGLFLVEKGRGGGANTTSSCGSPSTPRTPTTSWRWTTSPAPCSPSTSSPSRARAGCWAAPRPPTPRTSRRSCASANCSPPSASPARTDGCCPGIRRIRCCATPPSARRTPPRTRSRTRWRARSPGSSTAPTR